MWNYIIRLSAHTLKIITIKVAKGLKASGSLPVPGLPTLTVFGGCVDARGDSVEGPNLGQGCNQSSRLRCNVHCCRNNSISITDEDCNWRSRDCHSNNLTCGDSSSSSNKWRNQAAAAANIHTSRTVHSSHKRHHPPSFFKQENGRVE